MSDRNALWAFKEANLTPYGQEAGLTPYGQEAGISATSDAKQKSTIGTAL